MKKETWDKGKELLKRIDEVNNKLGLLEDILKRADEITGEYQTAIQIQLGEEYIHTPRVIVDYERFVNYIQLEMESLKLDLQVLSDKFERL